MYTVQLTTHSPFRAGGIDLGIISEEMKEQDLVDKAQVQKGIFYSYVKGFNMLSSKS